MPATRLPLANCAVVGMSQAQIDELRGRGASGKRRAVAEVAFDDSAVGQHGSDRRVCEAEAEEAAGHGVEGGEVDGVEVVGLVHDRTLVQLQCQRVLSRASDRSKLGLIYSRRRVAYAAI